MQFNNLKKSLDLDLKRPELSYWALINFIITWTSKNTRATIINVDLFYNIACYTLELDLKNTRITLLDFGLILCCIGPGLDKHLDYATGVGFISLYIGLGLIKLLKQGCR